MKRALLSLSLLLIFTLTSFSQYITAEDDASNYTTWTNGSNQGFGFSNWDLTANNNNGTNIFAGYYIGSDPTQNGRQSIATEGKVFGLYANASNNTAYAIAKRLFVDKDNSTRGLNVGEIFSVNMSFSWNGGKRGLNLFGGDGNVFLFNVEHAGSNALNATDGVLASDIFNKNVRLQFLWNGGANNNLTIYVTIDGITTTHERTISSSPVGFAVYTERNGIGDNGNYEPFYNNFKISTIDPSAITSLLDVKINGNIELADDEILTVNNLTIDGGNSFTIKSSLTGSGSLIVNGIVSGDVTVERYIAAATWGEGDDGWHLISSPVAAQSISGSWSPTGVDNNYDFYGWNESGNLWMNHKDAGFSTWNGGNNFNVGQGYMAAYQQTGTKTFVGALNNAAVTKNNLSITSGNYSGWHLVGNPFSSAIDWSNANWVKTGFLSSAKVWVEAYKAYKDVTNDYSNTIPSANGFWVNATEVSNTLTIPLEARTHNSLNWLKSGTSSGYIILTARDIEGNSAQESIIRIDPNATDGFDTDYDAQFMSGYAPMFYSVVESQYVSLNTLPELENKIINLGFVKNNAQEFSIELNTEHNIPGREIYLTDLKTGAVANLTDGQPYLFTSEEGDEPNRFMLNFSMVGIEDQPESDKISIYGNQRSIFISNAPANSTITLTSITGQVLMRTEATGSGLTTLNAEKLPKGVYVVSLIAGGKQISRKVVL
ncbi:MAG: hypothetical protein FD170_3720 [Bacteroidetes bacterium]|nr:MAG: hypothetical protein FD170_3720 [Bacteroidota bacterium]